MMSTRSPEARRTRTIARVVAPSTLGLVFDGYDLVVYGTVVSTFLRDPARSGAVIPAWPARSAATRSSGSSSAPCWPARGRLHRPPQGHAHRLCLVLRLDGGHRDGHQRRRCSGSRGSSPASASAHWSPRPARSSPSSPRGKKNLCNAITYCRRAVRQPARRAAGHPAAGLDRLARDVLDRCASAGHPVPARLLQDAGVAGLAVTRGRIEEARADRGTNRLSRAGATRRPAAEPAGDASGRASRAVRSPTTGCPRVLLGLMSATGAAPGLLAEHLAAGLMERAGFNTKGSLASCWCSTAAPSRALPAPASPTGSEPKPVVASSFLLGAVRSRADRCRWACCWSSSRWSASAPAAPRP